MALRAAATNETDESVAIKLFTAAANEGFAGSAWNLCGHFDDVGEAARAELWLKRAAKLDNTIAISILRGQVA